MYKYLEHAADMGIYGEGKNYQEAFAETAKAMFNLMVKLEQLKPLKSIKIKVQAPDINGLLIEWLNQLIAEKDINNLYFSDFKITKLQKVEEGLELIGEARGQEIDPEKVQVNVEVKGATFYGLECGRKDKTFYCQCVVDI